MYRYEALIGMIISLSILVGFAVDSYKKRQLKNYIKGLGFIGLSFPFAWFGFGGIYILSTDIYIPKHPESIGIAVGLAIVLWGLCIKKSWSLLT